MDEATSRAVVGGAYWLLEKADLTVSEMNHFARSDNVGERFSLADNVKLNESVYLVLAADNDPMVRSGILLNYSVSAQVIDRLAQSHPEDARFAAGHPNAAPSLKATLPLCEHSDFAVDRFLEDVVATAHERDALHRAKWAHPPETRTLGEVWAAIRPAGA